MSGLNRFLFVVCFSLIPSVLFAQDSVSATAGWPGDAIDAYQVNEQKNSYVVDLTPLQSSWGTQFGIAPIVKTSRDSANPQSYFNHLLNAQAISAMLLKGKPFFSNNYSVWNGPGFGINSAPNTNLSSPSVDTTGWFGNQFAVGFVEAGGSNFISKNVIGAIINTRNENPGRLYVTRMAGAQNGTSGECGFGSFGMGAIDASGQMYFRGDNFGAVDCEELTGLGGMFGVNLAARDYSRFNVISGQFSSTPLLDLAATTRMFIENPNMPGTEILSTALTPNIIPTEVAGTPKLIATTFGVGGFEFEYMRGSADACVADRSHYAPGLQEQRGALAYTFHQFPSLLGNNVGGTSAMLGKFELGGIANVFNIFGLDLNGNVTGVLPLQLPADSVVDPTTGFDAAFFGGTGEFDHYHSQVAFQGGNSQIALGKDRSGNLLAAAEVSYPEQIANDNPLNYIAVVRVNPTTGNQEWVMAGYNDGTFDGTGQGEGTGKPILDGPGGNIIGRMVPLFALTGGSPQGPSVSAPMIDSVGNVWFLSACEFFKADKFGAPYSDYDTALLRAIYNEESFSFELEKIFEVGDVFPGMNSDTNWQVRFIGIADSNSVSSSSAWSNNMLQMPHSTVGSDCLASLQTRDARTLGGVVINATIVYDVDGDGDFNPYWAENPKGVDQRYGALLYVGALNAERPFGDLNQDNQVNLEDIMYVLAAFSNAANFPNGDIAPCGGDGRVNLLDIMFEISAFLGVPNPCQCQ